MYLCVGNGFSSPVGLIVEKYCIWVEPVIASSQWGRFLFPQRLNERHERTIKSLIQDMLHDHSASLASCGRKPWKSFTACREMCSHGCEGSFRLKVSLFVILFLSLDMSAFISLSPNDQNNVTSRIILSNNAAVTPCDCLVYIIAVMLHIRVALTQISAYITHINMAVRKIMEARCNTAYAICRRLSLNTSQSTSG